MFHVPVVKHGVNLFVKAMPFNFYAIFSVIFVGLICSEIIRDYGPMKKAEERALKEGKLLRDGAVPLMSTELTEMKKSEKVKTRVFLNFILPIIMFLVILHRQEDDCVGEILIAVNIFFNWIPHLCPPRVSQRASCALSVRRVLSYLRVLWASCAQSCRYC